MDFKDKILETLKSGGPSAVTDIAKKIGQNTLIASSVLSELTSAGNVKITHVKYGSGPFYYLPEHLAMVEPLHKHLNEKDRRTFNLLKEQKILREKEQEPLTRVSLSNIKDFALPLKVNLEGEPEIVWKYFLISNEEAIAIIKERFINHEQKKIEEKQADDTAEEKSDTKTEKKIERKPEPFHKSEQTHKPETEKSETPKSEKIAQSSLNSIVTHELSPNLSAPPEGFMKKIVKRFNELQIEIVKTDIIKKNSEYELMIKVPSPIGKLDFYCRAKAKKKINEGDISSAYITGQSKKLPVLFVTDGKLNKKSEDMVKDFKNNFSIFEV